MSVLLETSLGDIVIDLHTDLCPVTTKNFLKLCKIKYYNNCLFFNVQKDFMVQTGDPTNGGKGGDSIYKFLYGDQGRFFDDEIRPQLKHNKIGTVAMASAGENANASQFYITTRAEVDYLDEKHTIFGEVAEGLEALMRINEAYVDDNGRPYKNIRLKKTHVLDDPFPDPPQLEDLIPDKSPELKHYEGEEVRLEEDWRPMDETMDPEELEKSLREKEAHSRAVVLEMIGDLPEAEAAPPENVLFVCKLNPATEDEDLEIIFSRFGKIVACDIIRDFKTGDSLCYGFVEFENKESCEAAYYKMDNVLIDDRRVHVDFSQSVSRLWGRYRRFGTKDSATGAGNMPGGGGPKGRGCFTCGEMGHIAKNCPNKGQAQDQPDAEAGGPGPKYELKSSAGPGRNYRMVFDEGALARGGRQDNPGEEGGRKRGSREKDVVARRMGDEGERVREMRRREVEKNGHKGKGGREERSGDDGCLGREGPVERREVERRVGKERGGEDGLERWRPSERGGVERRIGKERGGGDREAVPKEYRRERELDEGHRAKDEMYRGRELDREPHGLGGHRGERELGERKKGRDDALLEQRKERARPSERGEMDGRGGKERGDRYHGLGDYGEERELEERIRAKDDSRRDGEGEWERRRAEERESERHGGRVRDEDRKRHRESGREGERDDKRGRAGREDRTRERGREEQRSNVKDGASGREKGDDRDVGRGRHHRDEDRRVRREPDGRDGRSSHRDHR